MTKEMALYLLRSKDVYLTQTGRKLLQKMIAKDNKKKAGAKQ
jgi:hypothetical protein